MRRKKRESTHFMIHVLSLSQLRDLLFFMPKNQPSAKIIFGKPASTGKNRRAELDSRDSHHSHPSPGIRPFVDGIIENKAAEKLPQETELLDTFGPKLLKEIDQIAAVQLDLTSKIKKMGRDHGISVRRLVGTSLHSTSVSRHTSDPLPGDITSLPSLSP